MLNWNMINRMNEVVHVVQCFRRSQPLATQWTEPYNNACQLKNWLIHVQMFQAMDIPKAQKVGERLVEKVAQTVRLYKHYIGT